MRKTTLIFVLLFLSSCGSLGWLGKSDAQKKLEEGTSKPTKIPSELDAPIFNDPMAIPDIQDFRGLSGSEIELGLPDPLATNFGVEQILIRRLGDNRWVFVDLPVATVWPRVLIFFEEKNFPLTSVEVSGGRIETDWVVGSSGDAENIFESLGNLNRDEIQDSLYEYSFNVLVEAGVRSGSTELYVEERNRLRNDENLSPPWDGVSDDPALESKMLSALAYYIGERIAEGPSISLAAATRQASKVETISGESGTVLKYRLDFDRTWATIGRALEDAEVEVIDLDRSAGVYYVNYSSLANSKGGFLKRIFNSEGEKKEGRPFLVTVSSQSGQIIVNAAPSGESLPGPEDLVLRERLIKIIKEYST